MIGGGEALARAAHEFPPPRLDALRRTGNLTVVFALAVTTLSTFLVVLLVPAADQAMWVNAHWPAWRSTWPDLRGREP